MIVREVNISKILSVNACKMHDMPVVNTVVAVKPSFCYFDTNLEPNRRNRL